MKKLALALAAAGAFALMPAAPALASLERAVELAPDNARYAYVYGVGLNSAGRSEKAIAVLTSAHSRHPGPCCGP